MQDDNALDQLTAGAPVEARILRRNPDGSGIVEMPVCVEEQRVNLRLTSGGQNRVISITRAHMAQMAANFRRWKGPIPINRHPHLSWDESAGPAMGFCEALEVRGDKLWGRLFLTAPLMAEVAAHQWRGFSPDLVSDLIHPSFEIQGAGFAGGVFTNRPATDDHFKIAIAAASQAGFRGEIGTTALMQFSVSDPDSNSESETAAEPPHGDKPMADQDASVQLAAAVQDAKNKGEEITQLMSKVESQKTDLKKRDDRITELESELLTERESAAKARQSVVRLESDLKERDNSIASLSGEVRSERSKRLSIESEQKGTKVIQLSRHYVREGVPPSFFGAQGLKDVEKDPMAWLGSRFGGSIESLEATLKAVPKTASLGSTTSGHELDSDESDPVMDKDRKEALEALGLDPAFAGVTNRSQLNAVVDRKKAAGK